MTEKSNSPSQLANDDAPSLPAVADRTAFQAELDALRVREKAHTREGDALAAARRRLPMVEVDSTIELIGPDGALTLLDAFEGRRQLIAYFFMWYPGKPAPEQCEGCTLYNGQVRELAYLHSRDVTYATLCYGPFEESLRYRDFMGWDMPWYSVQDSAERLLAAAMGAQHGGTQSLPHERAPHLPVVSTRSRPLRRPRQRTRLTELAPAPATAHCSPRTPTRICADGRRSG